ncbi:MAG TPA: hypothetical protein VMN82_15250 [Thermoanaerobaculia bacterium]|nr:hypothetical protein [Thermoanaerobaculia bacterium]
MTASRSLRFSFAALLAASLAALAACKGTDTTTAPGSLANVTLNAPGSASSGNPFVVDVAATAVGVSNVQNGMVMVTLPAPLAVTAVDASSGTSATFSNGAGATVTWTLGVLDSNSQSTLHVTTEGTLPAGSSAETLTLQASLTATGITAGSAVASANVQLTP